MHEADLVIFISEFARQFIEKLDTCPINKMAIIPHGVDRIFVRDTGKPSSLPDWFIKEDYMLYVSSIDVYKSQCEVIEAYNILKERNDSC